MPEPRPNLPPLHGISTSLACARTVEGDRECGALAEWHVSWADLSKRAVLWDNSLACGPCKTWAEARWDMGWRHRVLPACALPGALLHIADEGTDEEGWPLSYCAHPYEYEFVLAVAEESTSGAFVAMDQDAHHG
jgi:hypothetical protein